MELGNGKKCKVLGKGTIGKHPNLTIENVDFVKGLTHNLISGALTCHMSLNFIFPYVKRSINIFIYQTFANYTASSEL